MSERRQISVVQFEPRASVGEIWRILANGSGSLSARNPTKGHFPLCRPVHGNSSSSIIARIHGSRGFEFSLMQIKRVIYFQQVPCLPCAVSPSRQQYPPIMRYAERSLTVTMTNLSRLSIGNHGHPVNFASGLTFHSGHILLSYSCLALALQHARNLLADNIIVSHADQRIRDQLPD